MCKSQPVETKLGDGNSRLSLFKLVLQPPALSEDFPRCIHSASELELELEWVASPSGVHLQCALLLHRHEASLADLGQVLASDAESDRLAAQVLLDYTAESFPAVSKSRALLAWPASAIRKLVQRLGADAAESEPPVLGFVVAWVGEGGAEGCGLLEALIGSVDLGWTRALPPATDASLTPHEQRILLHSPTLQHILLQAFSAHYRPSPPAPAPCASAGTAPAPCKRNADHTPPNPQRRADVRPRRAAATSTLAAAR